MDRDGGQPMGYKVQGTGYSFSFAFKSFNILKPTLVSVLLPTINHHHTILQINAKTVYML